MKKIIDCTTGEVIERPLNAEELAQQEIDEAAYQAAEAIRLSEAEARAEAKASAQAKLAALGLTVEDLQALGL
jgi:hypothetical protein